MMRVHHKAQQRTGQEILVNRYVRTFYESSLTKYRNNNPELHSYEGANLVPQSNGNAGDIKENEGNFD